MSSVLDEPLEMFIRRPSAANRLATVRSLTVATTCGRMVQAWHENGLSRAVDNGGYFGQPHPRKL